MKRLFGSRNHEVQYGGELWIGAVDLIRPGRAASLRDGEAVDKQFDVGNLTLTGDGGRVESLTAAEAALLLLSAFVSLVSLGCDKPPAPRYPVAEGAEQIGAGSDLSKPLASLDQYKKQH